MKITHLPENFHFTNLYSQIQHPALRSINSDWLVNGFIMVVSLRIFFYFSQKCVSK